MARGVLQQLCGAGGASRLCLHRGLTKQLLAAPARLQQRDVGQLEQHHAQEADDLDRHAGRFDLAGLDRATGLHSVRIGLLLDLRDSVERPLVHAEGLEVADFAQCLGQRGGSVALGWALEPFQVRDVGSGVGEIGLADDVHKLQGRDGGRDVFLDLAFDRGKRVSGQVLQATAAGDQHAVRKQPLVCRFDKFVRMRSIVGLNMHRGRQLSFVRGL